MVLQESLYVNAVKNQPSQEKTLMSYPKIKTEGGHKRGHSNMSHFIHTEEIKKASKKKKRQQNKNELKDNLQ